MRILSATTKALMKAVISAPPTDLAHTVCCEFNHFASLISLQSVHLFEHHLKLRPACCYSSIMIVSVSNFGVRAFSYLLNEAHILLGIHNHHQRTLFFYLIANVQLKMSSHFWTEISKQKPMFFVKNRFLQSAKHLSISWWAIISAGICGSTKSLVGFLWYQPRACRKKFDWFSVLFLFLFSTCREWHL